MKECLFSYLRYVFFWIRILDFFKKCNFIFVFIRILFGNFVFIVWIRIFMEFIMEFVDWFLVYSICFLSFGRIGVC